MFSYKFSSMRIRSNQVLIRKFISTWDKLLNNHGPGVTTLFMLFSDP